MGDIPLVHEIGSTPGGMHPPACSMRRSAPLRSTHAGDGTWTQGNRRTGGRVLVDALRVHGVDTVFCVPGESYLAALDALYDARDAIATIACRHEGGAANMAEACGKLTGRPGEWSWSPRGPGACHAAVGLHTAAQDSTPMVMFIGQVERGHSDREAFQEIEYRRFLAPLCKWVVQINDPARIPEFVSQAFHRACSGRPGPVAVALPEDRAGRGDHRRGYGPVHGGHAGGGGGRCDPGPAGVARRRAPSARDRRRRRLVRASERGSRPLRGGERARHRGVVPLPGPPRQHPPLLRGRPRAGPSIRSWPSGSARPISCW